MVRKTGLYKLSNVDLRLLHVFKTVVACGGVTAAEFELNVGRSTISKHLSDLETRLNLRLCHRGPAGFSLTSDGEYVLEAAEELFASIDQFQEKLDDARVTLSGKLKIASFDHCSTNPAARLSDALRNFVTRAPGVTLDIAMEPPNVIEEGVINGKYNVGVIPKHRASSMLSYLDLYTEDMRLYCGCGHPLFHQISEHYTLDTLREHPSAGLNINSPSMAMHQELRLRKAAHAQNEEHLMLLILSGKFIGFLPTHKAAPFLASGQIRELPNDKARFITTMTAVVRKSASTGRRLTLFLNCLREAHEILRK